MRQTADALDFRLGWVWLSFVVLANCSAPPAQTSSPSDMKLYRFECGHFEFSDLGNFGSEGEYDGRSGEMVVSCFLVRHPKGDLLWDSGLPDSVHQVPEGVVENGTRVTVPKTLESQVLELGLSLSDIEYFAPSHSHLDHFGNAPLFAGSSILMRSEEVDFMQGQGQALGLVLPETVTEEVLESVDLIEGVHDVFDDGRVLIVPALGHTPGHNVLQLSLPNTGAVFLTGDLYHLDESRSKRIVPRFNFSKPQTLEAMTEIEARIEQTNAMVIIQHSAQSITQVPDVPGHLD